VFRVGLGTTRACWNRVVESQHGTVQREVRILAQRAITPRKGFKLPHMYGLFYICYKYASCAIYRLKINRVTEMQSMSLFFGPLAWLQVSGKTKI
jgi:hypothetical protein